MISEREIYDNYMDAYCQFIDYDGLAHKEARKEAMNIVRDQLEYLDFNKQKSTAMVLKAVRVHSKR